MPINVVPQPEMGVFPTLQLNMLARREPSDGAEAREREHRRYDTKAQRCASPKFVRVAKTAIGGGECSRAGRVWYRRKAQGACGVGGV